MTRDAALPTPPARVPESADVLVLPGMPGRPAPADVDGPVYPGSTTDVVKLLREQGLKVEYTEPRERRQTIELKAAEDWIPILWFAYEVAANGAGDILAQAVLGQLGGRSSKTRLHVECGYENRDGEAVWFNSEGPADEVLEALREWKPSD